MKTISFRAAVLALLAISVVGCNPSQAQDQTTTPGVTGNPNLPPGIASGSETAEVLKLTQAGLDTSVINAYIANAPNAFNLDADQIITLKDAGVPSVVINSMMDRDRTIMASTVTTTAPAAPTPDTAPPPPDTSSLPAPDVSQEVTDNAPDTAPPPPVNIEYFDETLGGYGTWIMVPGYGRCWRPTTVIYDVSWRPYCDHGHWVYTDCGWYWESDYAWGATFHYGRWFRDASFGWCWYPDYVWAPSWVCWRSSDDYCGWAPLPPFTIYQPGVGLLCRGTVVTVGFDFGFGADAFIFIDHDHFCDHRPRDFCLDRHHGDVVFQRTTIINNFDIHNTVVVNNGISVDKVRPHNKGARDPNFHPVSVGSMADARREGWRGPVTVAQHAGPGNPSHDTHRTGGQPQGGANFNGNSHTFNNNGNTHQGVTSFNNQGGNNNTAISHNPHGTTPTTGNPGTHFNSGPGQSTVTTPTTANNNNFQNNHGSSSVARTENNPSFNNNPSQNSHDNHAANQGQSANHTPNNNYNNQVVTHPNNPAFNNNNSQNNRVVSQSPGAGNASSAHYYSSPTTTPTAPAVHNPVANYNNHSEPSGRWDSGNVNPGYNNSSSMNQRSQPQYQAPQNSYQPRYNNNNNNNYPASERSYSAPRSEPAPQSPQPQERSSAPAYSAPAYSSHNSGQSSSGNSGSSQGGGQSHSSGNGNGNQQGH